MTPGDTLAQESGIHAESASIGLIPAFDYLRGLGEQRESILAAMARVLDSGSLILGPEVTAFECEFASFVGAKHAVGMSSGTDALIVALRVLDVRPGDEVITVANGPVPTVAAIRAVGAMPRFVDIDPASMQLSADLAEHAITERTRCIIPLHLYGQAAPVEPLISLCRKHGLSLIEDCAQAHGTYIGNRHAGTFGDVGCFSFYPTKNLGAFGDAGLCVTNNDQLANRLREQACYGFHRDRIAHCEGLNCRLDELQAACLRVRLERLPAALARRSAIARRYLTGLAHTKLQLPVEAVNQTPAWHQFVIRVSQREEWIKWLASQRIEVGVHYPVPVHLMPAYQPLGYPIGSLPATEEACRQVLSLPMYPELTSAEIDRVLRALQLGLANGLT